MYRKNKILAFIGARQGSKGLKNKNILQFGGKPLICWTIEASLNSKYIDNTLVSTDGEKIAQISKAAGANVPFLRPANLATDKALIQEALRHAIKWLKEKNGQTYDYIILLQPTSPLRTTQHIDGAIAYYFRHCRSSNDTLVSVTKAPVKTGWLLEKNSKGYIDFCFDIKGQKIRRQNIPRYYLPNGLIYMAPIKRIYKGSFYSSCTLPFVMDEEVSIDIDSMEDFEVALKRFRSRSKSST